MSEVRGSGSGRFIEAWVLPRTMKRSAFADSTIGNVRSHLFRSSGAIFSRVSDFLCGKRKRGSFSLVRSLFPQSGAGVNALRRVILIEL